MLKFTLAAGLAIAALSTAANAADIVHPPSMVTSSSAASWSGFYAGVNGGYGPGTASSGYYDGEGAVSFSGLFLGGQLGYNFQLENGLVFGLEGDLNWSNESGTTSTSEDGGEYTYSSTDTLNWFGAVTGHVGYAWDTFEPYVLAGVAFANNNIAEHENDYGDIYDSSSTANHLGFTVGAGAAAMLTNNISAFTEVRYSNYGSANYTTTYDYGNETTTAPVSLVDTMVRGGLNFHF